MCIRRRQYSSVPLRYGLKQRETFVSMQGIGAKVSFFFALCRKEIRYEREKDLAKESYGAAAGSFLRRWRTDCGEEAAERLRKYGPMNCRRASKRAFFGFSWSQFADFLVII
jgi:hypothetical protein